MFLVCLTTLILKIRLYLANWYHIGSQLHLWYKQAPSGEDASVWGVLVLCHFVTPDLYNADGRTPSDIASMKN